MDETNPRMGDALGKVKQGMTDFGSAASLRKSELTDQLTRFVQERPLAAVGAALGIGYVLGGGLFSKTTGRLFSIGLRLGAVALAKGMFNDLDGADRPF